MGRQFIVFIGASVAGFVVLGLVESLSWLIYPVPEGVDLSNSTALADYVAQVPFLAKLMVLLAWVLGAFVAGYVAGRFAPDGSATRLALMAGGVLLLGGIMNAFMVPHPIWMLVIGLAQYLPVAWIGSIAAR